MAELRMLNTRLLDELEEILKPEIPINAFIVERKTIDGFIHTFWAKFDLPHYKNISLMESFTRNMDAQLSPVFMSIRDLVAYLGNKYQLTDFFIYEDIFGNFAITHTLVVKADPGNEALVKVNVSGRWEGGNCLFSLNVTCPVNEDALVEVDDYLRKKVSEYVNRLKEEFKGDDEG